MIKILRDVVIKGEDLPCPKIYECLNINGIDYVCIQTNRKLDHDESRCTFVYEHKTLSDLRTHINAESELTHLEKLEEDNMIDWSDYEEGKKLENQSEYEKLKNEI